MAPAAPGEAARHPVHRALHAVGVEDHQSRHRPAEERRDGDAREHHAHRMHAVVPRQRKDERDGDHRADESAERHELDFCGEEDHDAHGGQSRARRYADDAGISERILQYALQDAAGEREVHARQSARDDARQTDVVEDAIVLGRAVSHECRHDGLGRDVHCTRRSADDERKGERDKAEGEGDSPLSRARMHFCRKDFFRCFHWLTPFIDIIILISRRKEKEVVKRTSYSYFHI